MIDHFRDYESSPPPSYVIARIVLLSSVIDVQVIHGFVSAYECSRNPSQTRQSRSGTVKRAILDSSHKRSVSMQF